MNYISRIDNRAVHELAFAREIVQLGKRSLGERSAECQELDALEPYLFSAIRRGHPTEAAQILEQRIQEWKHRQRDDRQRRMMDALTAMQQQLTSYATRH